MDSTPLPLLKKANMPSEKEFTIRAVPTARDIEPQRDEVEEPVTTNRENQQEEALRQRMRELDAQSTERRNAIQQELIAIIGFEHVAELEELLGQLAEAEVDAAVEEGVAFSPGARANLQSWVETMLAGHPEVRSPLARRLESHRIAIDNITQFEP